MQLILTSDFPATPNEIVVARLRATARTPRIAWIPPQTDPGATCFDEARARFADLGFEHLECVAIAEDRDDVQIAYLHEFDVIYLTAGDPVRFRYNALRSGLVGRLRQCIALDRLVVAASGGALLLTPNVSLFRLQHESVDDVLADRGRFEALGAVNYELLPHCTRWDAAFLERVRSYSSRVDNDIVALPEGAALLATDASTFETAASVTRYRKGNIIQS